MAQVTITDEEYSNMLADRLAAMHAFENGSGTYEAYLATRATVRRARKVRKSEGAVVENYKQQSAPQNAAKTRKGQAQPATPVKKEIEVKPDEVQAA